MVVKRSRIKILIMFTLFILLFNILNPNNSFASISKVGTLTTPRYGTSAVYYNNETYIFGGLNIISSSYKYYDDILTFDSNNQLNKINTVLSTPRTGTTSSVGVNGKIYIFGGQQGNGSPQFKNDVLCYNPTDQSISKLNTMFDYGRRYACSAATPDGNIYIFGGDSSGTVYNDIWKFDSNIEQLTKLQVKLPQKLSLSTATLANNGKIYLFGGYYGNSDSILVFDPVNMTISTLATKLPSQRYGSTSTLVNGEIYIIGGYCPGVDTYLSDILVFNPDTEQISYAKESLPQGRYCSSSVTDSTGNVLVVGGRGGNDGNIIYDDILSFKPSQLDLQAPVITGFLDDNDVNLSWNSIYNANAYILERSLDGVNFSQITDTSNLNYKDLDLQPGTYYYRVKAKNSTSESDYSNVVTLTVDDPTPPPPANKLYVFWPTGGTNVEVDWVRGDIDLTGNMVQLFRKDTIADYWMPVKTIVEEEKDSFIYHDDNVTESLNYKYQIRRFDMATWEWIVAAESDWAVLERPYPAPGGLEVISSTDNSAIVSWEPIDRAGSYQVNISTDGGNTWQNSTVSSTTTTVPKPCLFRVKAGTHARSQWSGILTVQ